MLSSTNFWMGLGGLIYLVVGVFILRDEIAAARGWDKLITLAGVLIAVSLAMFAPEHFHGPMFVQNMVPSWMPGHLFWAYFVGGSLLAAATSLTVKRLERLSTTLLGLMFSLFVCMIYLPSLLAHLDNRLAWTFALRDLTFAAGAWALAGRHSRHCRDWSPRPSRSMILFARIVIASAAVFFGVVHLLHPGSAPGVPLEKISPAWVPVPQAWGYLSGVILLAAGIGLLLNRRARLSAAAIGALMVILTLFLYLLDLIILLLAHGGSGPEINEALNYVADTLLFGGSALALASALPHDHRET